MVIFLIIVVVVLWLLWKLIVLLCEGLVIAFPYIVNMLLILLGLALVAGIVWLFLPYRGIEDDKNKRKRKKLEDNS